MSSTSGSWTSRSVPASARRLLAVVRDDDSAPSSSYQAGIWWPHQSWREMHQGRMFSSQCSQVFPHDSGTSSSSPSRQRAEAPARHPRDVAEPLRRDQRLDRLAAALAVADVVDVLLDSRTRKPSARRRSSSFARAASTVESRERRARRRRSSGRARSITEMPGRVVPAPDLEVGGVVERA